MKYGYASNISKTSDTYVFTLMYDFIFSSKYILFSSLYSLYNSSNKTSCLKILSLSFCFRLFSKSSKLEKYLFTLNFKIWFSNFKISLFLFFSSVFFICFSDSFIYLLYFFLNSSRNFLYSKYTRYSSSPYFKVFIVLINLS